MPQDFDLSVGLVVRVTGGKFNGYEGQIAKLCDAHCSLLINHENQTCEVITETQWLTPLHLWTAQKNAVELALRGHHDAAR